MEYRVHGYTIFTLMEGKGLPSLIFFCRPLDEADCSLKKSILQFAHVHRRYMLLYPRNWFMGIYCHMLTITNWSSLEVYPSIHLRKSDMQADIKHVKMNYDGLVS
jgi:hypothetical protein